MAHISHITLDGLTCSFAAQKRFSPDAVEAQRAKGVMVVDMEKGKYFLSWKTEGLPADLEGDTSATNLALPYTLSRRISVVFWRTITM